MWGLKVWNGIEKFVNGKFGRIFLKNYKLASESIFS